LARYNESVCRLCRNEGLKLFLKGERCETPKCAFERRPYRTGPHGQARKKLSEYAIQLREKQKVRRLYGLLEKQFSRTFQTSARKKGTTGTLFLQRLESRLDNLVYRAGLGASRPQSRQWVAHGHFLVNGQKVTIPSYLLKPGDVITVRPRSQALIKALLETRTVSARVPHWLELNESELSVRLVALPAREDLDQNIKENLIIEYYSR
jgi:small subunit ribosomal protein S4